MQGQRIASGRLAGLGPAEPEHMPARRLSAEVVIEGHDAVHLGARDVQRFGDQRLGGFLDIAELLLQRVEDRQKRTFAIEAFPNALKRDILVPSNAVSIATSLMHCGHRSYFRMTRIIRINKHFIVITKACRINRRGFK
jgi:hypothetical protein